MQVRAHRIASIDSHVGPTIQRYVEENCSRKTVEALGDSLLSSQESPLFFLTTYLLSGSLSKIYRVAKAESLRNHHCFR